MKKLWGVVTSILLVLAMAAGPAARTGLAFGNDKDDEKPIRLYATAMTGPIGSVDSFGQVSINGRTTHGRQIIWGGEVLQATRANARVSLDDIGDVTLAGGALARISSSSVFDGGSREMLVATLVKGEITISLSGGARAYVEACGERFAASSGASFRVSINESRAVSHVVRGTVEQVQAPERKYKIRPIGIGSNVSVRARATRQIQVQVTDENDRPIPDLPILFLLGGGGGGSLGAGTAAATSLTISTNAQGIATTSFTAGQTASSTSITASVPGTTASTTIGVSVNAAGFFTATTIGLIAAGVAGAATVAVVATQQNQTEDIQAQPPVITPRQ
jgi:hypothetical protein